MNKNGSFDLRSFKAWVIQRLEKAQEKILSSWYPTILGIFYRGSKKKEWSSIANSKMEQFFYTVSLILADQLAEIIKETIIDFVALFDVKDCAQRFKSVGKCVSFMLKPILEETSIQFETMTSEIESTVLALFNSILTSINRIPKIETQLFATGPSTAETKVGMASVTSEECISINFEARFPDFVSDMRATLRSRMKIAFEYPPTYMLEFNKHSPVIVRETEKEVDVFIASESGHDSLADVFCFGLNLGG